MIPQVDDVVNDDNDNNYDDSGDDNHVRMMMIDYSR